MAHTVTFSLDIRHVEDEKLNAIEKECREEFARIAEKDSERGCKLEWRELVDSPAVKFHPDCIAAVEASATEVCAQVPVTSEDGHMWKHMISGAGHDSCYTNRHVPTSMIFTVTKEGISHNPVEYCSPEDWYVLIFNIIRTSLLTVFSVQWVPKFFLVLSFDTTN